MEANLFWGRSVIRGIASLAAVLNFSVVVDTLAAVNTNSDPSKELYTPGTSGSAERKPDVQHSQQTVATITVYVEGVKGEILQNVAAYLEINQPPKKPAAEAEEPRLLAEIPAIGGILDKSVSSIVDNASKLATQTRKSGTGELKPLNSYPLDVDQQRLRWLHRRASEDIRNALKPFGYYHPKIDSTLEQHGNDWRAIYRIRPGPPVRVARAKLSVTGDGAEDPALQQVLKNFPLTEGAILVHQPYKALKDQLQLIATERGYFDAQLKTSEIRINLETNQAEIDLVFDAGRRYRFGEVRFPDDFMNQRFLQRFVKFDPGDPYESSKLQKLQADLINSDYFSRVEVNAPQDQSIDHRIPVTVILELRDPQRYDFGLGYGTDTGVRGILGYEHRLVNSRGHRFNAQALGSQIKYNLSARYEIPGQDPATDVFALRSGLFREDSDVKNTTSFLLGGSWKTAFGPWEQIISLDYGLESFRVADRDFTALLIPGIAWTRRTADGPINVTRGSRLDFQLRGSYEPLLSDLSFFQPAVRGKLIRTFGHFGRVIVRGELGTTIVSDFDELPPSLRFYAGGDNSVRGYGLDKIGPKDSEGNAEGGKNLIVGSLEYEYPLWGQWSAAAFADTGDTFNFDRPEPKTGVGIGFRWYSPVGPVRIDLAHALDQPPGNDIRLHFSFGPPL